MILKQGVLANYIIFMILNLSFLSYKSLQVLLYFLVLLKIEELLICVLRSIRIEMNMFLRVLGN